MVTHNIDHHSGESLPSQTEALTNQHFGFVLVQSLFLPTLPKLYEMMIATMIASVMAMEAVVMVMVMVVTVVMVTMMVMMMVVVRVRVLMMLVVVIW